MAIDQILIPPHPGITSALGLVCTDLRVDLMKTVLMSAQKKNQDNLLSTFSFLVEESVSRLESQGANTEDVQIMWMLDMRYEGQSHELSVGISEKQHKIVEESVKCFERIHEEAFGYKMEGRTVEWVTARVVAESSSGKFRPLIHSVDKISQQTSTRLILTGDGSRVLAEVYRRWDLATGQVVKGPSIIEQLDTTIYVGPEWSASQERDGVLWLRRDIG